MKTNMIRMFLIGLGFLCLVASTLFASTPETFGTSSRASATAGMGTFSNPDPSLAYQNPAFLSQARRVTVHVGWLSVADHFKPITDVVTQNKLTGKSVRRGDVNTDYPNLSGISFGLILPLRQSMPRVSVGTTGFVPFGSLASISTYESYVPVYANYYNRPKRFSWVVGASIEPIENFSIGVGGNIYLTSGANTKINLNENNSQVDIAMDIRPAVSPIVGARYQWQDWGVSLAYHAPVDYAMTLKNKTELPLLNVNGSDATIPIVEFLATTSTFYDPQMISMGITKFILGRVQVGFQGIWKNWKRYKLPVNEITFTNPGEVQSQLPDIRFRNVVSLGTGLEFPVGKLMVRGGYRFEPQHITFQELNSNLLDTDVHVVSTGLGVTIDKFTIDLHLQYHHLTPQRIEKTDATAVGYKEGGYILGGSLVNYGITLGTTF